VLLRVHNASLAPVVLSWVPKGGDEVSYATLRPNQVHTQQTFAGHRWRLTRRTGQGARGTPLPGHDDGGGELEAPPVDSTVIFTEGDGVSLISHTLIPMHALQDGCTVRARICGVITVTAVDAVRDEAVAACVECVTSIIDDMPEKAAVLRAMGALGVEVAIIGVGQTTTDVPAHAHLKGMDVHVGPARTFEDGTRGLGATVACPVMSVAEENLLPGTLIDRKYPDESILVHEFAHTVRLKCMVVALLLCITLLHSAPLRSAPLFSSPLLFRTAHGLARYGPHPRLAPDAHSMSGHESGPERHALVCGHQGGVRCSTPQQRVQLGELLHGEC